MTPAERALQVYLSEPCARTFLEDLTWHLHTGYVYSTPEAFILARYVRRDWPVEAILDPSYSPEGPKDTLHVYLAAGDMKELFKLPHTIPKWVSFERSNSLRFWDYLKIKQRVSMMSERESSRYKI